MDYANISLEELKATARSVDDIQQWLLAHPDVLLGDLAKLPVESLEVTLTHSSTFIGMALIDKAIHLELHIKATLKNAAHPLMTSVFALDDDVPYLEVDKKQNIKLALSEWPLATFMVVSRYLTNHATEVSNRRNWLRKHEAMLDTMLAKHFPGAYLQQLFDFNASEMFTCRIDRHGQRDYSSLYAYLYGTRRGQLDVNLPPDLAMPFCV